MADGVRTLLYDPQTAGGLLLAVTPQHAEPLLAELLAAGLSAARIGCVLDSPTEGAPWIELRSYRQTDPRREA
jgi:selenide,water dikinase